MQLKEEDALNKYLSHNFFNITATRATDRQSIENLLVSVADVVQRSCFRATDSVSVSRITSYVADVWQKKKSRATEIC